MYPQRYQELLDFLDSNPEYLHDLRVRLLSPELIALPEQFAQLVNIVAELSAEFRAFAEATNRRLAVLEDDVQVLKDDVQTLKTDVQTLKTDVQTLKDDVATLKGSDTERRARENILNIAKDELNLTRGRILLARGRDTAAQLLTAIDAAEQSGVITENEADNVLVADIIIRARRASDRQYVHGVFEVSRTVRLSDIQRARDRAATVAAATGEETIAAVIGEIIRPQQQAQADEMGVATLVPAMFQPEEPEGEPPEHSATSAD
ncbi:MAG: hypothetical protein F4X64_05155 [Chloroflexi bacterium]|nr:hypothetical protein [Chloroflexota bacterium]